MRTASYMAFQAEFFAVSERFPANYLEADFRPAVGSSEYARLEAFWLLCFSEWFATHRVDEDELGDLWAIYYAPMIGDALTIPSLRYVLEDPSRTGKLAHGEWANFMEEVQRIARKSGRPLNVTSPA